MGTGIYGNNKSAQHGTRPNAMHALPVQRTDRAGTVRFLSEPTVRVPQKRAPRLPYQWQSCARVDTVGNRLDKDITDYRPR